MANYIYYNYLTSTVCKVEEEKNVYEKYPNIKQYLNKQCLENGSSLQGRVEAFQYLTKQMKFTPVLVSLHPIVIYFPTESKSNPNCKWINYGQIQEIEYKEKECIIYFKDHTFFTCKHPNRIKNSMIHIKRFLRMISEVL